MTNIITYKPFSVEEVAKICDMEARLLDQWMADVVPIRRGPDSTPGVDYMGLLSIFSAKRWIEEGSGRDRAVMVLVFVMQIPEAALLVNFGKGNTFPVPRSQLIDAGETVPQDCPGILVSPPKGRLGNTLNLRIIKAQLDARLDQFWPRGYKNR